MRLLVFPPCWQPGHCQVPPPDARPQLLPAPSGARSGAMDLQSLCKVLQACVSPNTAERKQAEETLLQVRPWCGQRGSTQQRRRRGCSMRRRSRPGS